MKQVNKAKILKWLRTLHGWMGVFIFPWILIAGLTGFYLNHSRAVLPWLEGVSYDESQFVDWPEINLSEQQARDLSNSIFPNEDFEKITFGKYHGWRAITFDMPSGQVIVVTLTGHYFVKEGYTRKTFAPNGSMLHSKVYWGSVLKTLHTRGWLNSDLGTLLSDITSLALALFAISGLTVWWLPRAKKVRRFFARALPLKNS